MMYSNQRQQTTRPQSASEAGHGPLPLGNADHGGQRSRSCLHTFLACLALLALVAVGGCRTADHGHDTRRAHRVLMVVTSHDQIAPGHPTGLWLEEFATPYRIMRDAGCRITVASPQGGKAPVDPRSMEPSAKPENADAALAILEDTVRLADVKLEPFDGVFFVGGHGTMFDFPTTPSVTRTVEHFISEDLPIALVCHGPAALVGARRDDKTPVVQGRTITAFTNEEERAVELTEEMPFLLESRLRVLGAHFSEADAFDAHVVVDGNLVTGQNPASSAEAARRLLQRLAHHDAGPNG